MRTQNEGVVTEHQDRTNTLTIMTCAYTVKNGVLNGHLTGC